MFFYRTERIEKALIDAFSPDFLEIIDESYKHVHHNPKAGAGETHYKIIISADCFKGKSRIAIEREIHKILKEEWQNGLHALAIHYKPIAKE